MSMPEIKCKDLDKCCAAASLLQSIALEETAISHILNADPQCGRRKITESCENGGLQL